MHSPEAIRPDLTGTAIAVNNMITMTTGILQPAIGWVVKYISKSTVDLATLSVAHFKIAMLIVPIILFLAAASAIMAYRRMRWHCNN